MISCQIAKFSVWILILKLLHFSDCVCAHLFSKPTAIFLSTDTFAFQMCSEVIYSTEMSTTILAEDYTENRMDEYDNNIENCFLKSRRTPSRFSGVARGRAPAWYILTLFFQSFSFTLLTANACTLIQLFHLLLRFEVDVLMVLLAVFPVCILESTLLLKSTAFEMAMLPYILLIIPAVLDISIFASGYSHLISLDCRLN